MEKQRLGPQMVLMLVALLLLTALQPAEANDAVASKEPAEQRTIAGGDVLFIENEGQWEADILYLGKTSHGSVALYRDGISFDVRSLHPDDDIVEGCVVRLAFEGAHPVVPVGNDEVDTRYNFFLGKDNWRTGVSGFRTVTSPNLWDGIDLVYRPGPSGIKYDVIVAPGADPNDVSFRVEGSDGIFVTGKSLTISTCLGIDLRDSDLLSFDEDGRTVETRFCTEGNSYGFSVGEYDRSKELTIDPNIGALMFSTLIGGAGCEEYFDMDMDHEGNIYVCGQGGSWNFPGTTGSYQETINGWNDGLVCKLDSDGSSLIWATYFGGSESEQASSVAITGDGEVCIFGKTYSSDFPVTSGSYDTSFCNETDFFALKLDREARSLVFSTYIGGALG